MRTITVGMLATLLAGCAGETRMDWDLVEGDEIARALVLAVLGLRDQPDERARVQGPHVVGSSVEIAARHPNPNQVVEGWQLVSANTDVAQVDEVEADRNALHAALVLGEAGTAKLSVLDDGGEVVDSLVVTVAVPTGASVEPYVDLRAGDGAPVGDDGTLRLGQGGSVSLVLSWIGEEGAVLTGHGALSVDLPAEAVGKVSAETVASFSLDNLDYFTLDGAAPTGTTPVPLDVYAGEALVKTWQVEVLPTGALDEVVLAVELEPGLAADGSGEDRIGYLRPDVFSETHRVLGVDLVWFQDGAELGAAAFAELVEAPERHVIQACVPDTTLCADIDEFGRLGRLGDGVVDAGGGCACSQGGTGGSIAVLLGVLLGAVRRRKV